MPIRLIIALIAPPAYIVSANQNDLVKLVINGAVYLVAAFIVGHYLTVMARVPVMPTIRSPWLTEIRENLVASTLVAILLNKGISVQSTNVAAGRACSSRPRQRLGFTRKTGSWAPLLSAALV